MFFFALYILCHLKATQMGLIQNYEDLRWSLLHPFSKIRVKGEKDQVENPVEENRHKWDYSIPVSKDRAEEDCSIPASKNRVEKKRDSYELDNPIPTGFQFTPTNKELVTDYLMNKILRNPLPFWEFPEVEEVVLYSTHPKSLGNF